MRIPLVNWVAVWIQFIPLGIALWRRQWLTGARLGVALWLVLLLLSDFSAYSWTWILRRGNNLWISHTFLPVQSIAVLWAISRWQVRPLLRSTLQYCIPLLLVWWIVSIVFFEDVESFSRVGAPVYFLLALAAAMLTLATRARRTEDPLLEQDWLWLLAGLAIFFATNASTSIVQAAAIAVEDYDLAVRASKLKASIDIVAFLLLAGGFLWAPRQTSSGVSSSPAPSPSSSSSSPSWRRS